MSYNRISRLALRLTPQEKRNLSKNRRLRDNGLTWGEAEMAALDLIGWSSLAPCRAKRKKIISHINVISVASYFIMIKTICMVS